MSRLARAEREAGLLVDMPGGGQHAMGPQRNLCVSHSARKAVALVDEPRAQTQPARLGVYKEQPDTCRAGLIILHQHHAADIFAVQLRDPASLALCVEVVDEIGDDLRAEPFERVAPTVLLEIEFGMA